MRVLGGIPTRLRDTSGPIADILSSVCDKVIVVSQGAVVKAYNRNDNITVHEKQVNYGLVAARNYILEYAIVNDFDVVIQSDDDLSFKADVIEAMLKVLKDNPGLGTIASSSRAYFNWSKEVGSNKDFVLTPCGAQLWAAPTEILSTVGRWDLEFLEDRDYGARMWKLGYPIGLLHTTLQQTHNPFIARTTKTGATGGQEQGEIRQQRLSHAIDVLNERHGDIVTAKISTKEGSNRTFSTRYNWDKMLSFHVDKFGYSLGYEDQKGHKL